jgi:hypothetical protein
MAELEAEGVEHEPRSFRAEVGAPAMAVVPQDGQTVFGKVHADLVLAPGAGPGLDEKPTRMGLEEAEISLRFLRQPGSGRDRVADVPLTRGERLLSGRERVVRLHDRSLRELTRETRVGRAVLAEEDHAGSVAVQALMDAESNPAAAAVCAAMGEKPGQEADEVGPPWIHGLVRGKAGRLAHRHEPGILEEDVRGPQGRRGRALLSPNLGTQGRVDAASGQDRDPGPPRRCAFHPQGAGHDPTAHLGAGDRPAEGLAEPLLRPLVEPTSGLCRPHSARVTSDQGRAGAQRPPGPSCSQGRKPAL